MTDQATQLRKLIEAGRPSPASGSRAGAPGGSVIAPILPPSVLTGAVSYKPLGSAVATIKPTVASPPRHARPQHRPVKLAHAIAVTSGKGGVGKSNLAVNLAVAMSVRGLKVCLLDADLGMANADVLCNLTPRLTLEHVVAGKCKLLDATLLAPGGFRLIPGASGVARLADLSSLHRQALLEQLAVIEQVADVILIDCGAGISANVIGFAAAANTVVVTTTPEPTALTDGYGMIKSLFAQVPTASIEVVVNMAASEAEGRAVFDRLSRVTQTFLNKTLEYGGMIPNDPIVPQAVRQRVPFVLYGPDCPATRALKRLSAKLAGREDVVDGSSNDTSPRGGFFHRVASWMGLAESPA